MNGRSGGDNNRGERGGQRGGNDNSRSNNTNAYDTMRMEYNGSGMNYGGVEGRFRDDRREYDRPTQRYMMDDDNGPEMRRRRDSRGRFTRSAYDDEGDETEAGHVPYYPTYPPVYRNEYTGGEYMERGGKGQDRDRSTTRAIGFARDDEWPMEHDREYRAEVMTPSMHEVGYASGSMERGRGTTKAHAKMDMETAEKWMRNIQNADGTRGPHWTIEQAKQVMKQKNIEGVELPEFWAVLNMMYADYSKVFKRHGVGDKMDFYIDMAKAFVDDKDAVPNKVAEYYSCIVEGAE